MKTDRSTKLLLAVIGVALWMIALNPWLNPRPVSAQANTPFDFQNATKVKDEDLDRNVASIERQLRDLHEIRLAVVSIDNTEEKVIRLLSAGDAAPGFPPPAKKPQP